MEDKQHRSEDVIEIIISGSSRVDLQEGTNIADILTVRNSNRSCAG